MGAHSEGGTIENNILQAFNSPLNSFNVKGVCSESGFLMKNLDRAG